MSRKKKVHHQTASSAPVTKSAKPGLFQRTEEWLNLNHKILVSLIFGLGALFSFLLFDTKISEGGDDSMYIEAAYRYSQDYFGYFYRSNAPLYPMLLGIATIFTGLNLIIYKILNSVFFILHLVLLYKAFYKRIPSIVLMPVLLFSAINSYLLFFASQTYTEMLFLVLQTCFVIVFLRFYDKYQSATNFTWSMAIGLIPSLLLLLLLTLTKNIAVGMLGAVLVFLLIQKQFRLTLFLAGGYTALWGLWHAMVGFIWGNSNQYGSQGSILMQIDPYNAAKGTESIGGFITRFFTNLDLYTSKRLMQILGFREEYSTGSLVFVTLCIVALTLFAGWQIFRTNVNKFASAKQSDENESSSKNAALLVFLYVIMQLGLTFLVLQVVWDQSRLILVYVPMWLLATWYGLYLFFWKNKSNLGYVFYVTVVVIILASSFISSTKKSVAHFPILKKNLKGDKYYGYTPDWENYLKMSEWAAENLPPDALVACRKAPMSFVYGKGRTFFPVYSVVAVNPENNMSYPDSALSYFEENNVTHILIASLRMNPKKPGDQVINTLHRMLQPIANTYPGKIKFVHKIGETEPSFLYEITYSEPKSK